MLRCFLTAFAVCLAFCARAEEATEEINVVIFASGEKAGRGANRPECNDAGVLTAVAGEIAEYYRGSPATSIIGRRRQALLLKNLREFTEIPIDDFDNADNYAVASQLIMTKVNYHFGNGDLRLCKGNDDSDIYLLMYPEGSGTRVQILNFVPMPETGNEFSVYVEPAADNDAIEDNAVAEEIAQDDAAAEEIAQDDAAAEEIAPDNAAEETVPEAESGRDENPA